MTTVADQQAAPKSAERIPFRSRRLEALFGSPLGELQPDHVRGLVNTGVEEAFDLDFKLTLYGNSGDAKRNLAGDVAALANTAGGAIVIGVDEDDQGRATAAPGVNVTDAEAVRMHQVVAANVAPMPTIYIKKVVAAGPDPSLGFYVVAVPPSPTAPHAVLINEGRGLRYPQRNGASIRYLSEPEVAAAYRARDLAVVEQSRRAVTIAEEAGPRLAREEPWLLLTLVPDVPGSAPITSTTFKEFQESITNSGAMAVDLSAITYFQTQVGPRSFIAHDARQERSAQAKRARLQVYSDGSGSYALRLHDTSRNTLGYDSPSSNTDTPLIVNDEWLAVAVLSGLLRLGQHARDRAATSGNALLRLEIVMPEDRTVELGWTRSFRDSRPSTAAPGRPIVAEVSVELDAIATEGPDLVSATAHVGSEIVQAFGSAELGQFTTDGRIPLQCWAHNGWRPALTRWANAHGVTIVS